MEIISLCGFLGAGKTTTLKYLLENCPSGIRIGVIANDVASVNIDAQLIKNETSENGNIVSVQLENGCACCSGSEDLLEALGTLVKSDFNYILVESSGVAEAGQMRQVLSEAPCVVNKKAKLGPVLCVLDSFDFLDIYKCNDALQDREDLTGDGKTENPKRLLVDLMVEQIESSDIVIMNKIDRFEMNTNKLECIEEIIEKLNPTAKVLTTSFGKVDLGELKAKHHTHNHHHHCCDKECNHRHTHFEKYEISSFVFTSTKPFHGPSLVKNVLSKMSQVQNSSSFPALDEITNLEHLSLNDESVNPFKNVIRSKGFMFLGNQPTRKMYWSHAGRHFGVLPKGEWDQEVPKQELVFIGVRMNQEAITQLLNNSIQD